MKERAVDVRIFHVCLFFVTNSTTTTDFAISEREDVREPVASLIVSWST